MGHITGKKAAAPKRGGRGGRSNLFDRDGRGLRQLLLVGLGDRQTQDAVLVLGGDVFRGDVLPDVEAPAAGTGVALLADVLAVLVLLVLVQTLGGLDGQVAVGDLHVDLVLLEAGQVDVQLIAVIGLPHVGLHQVLAVLAIQDIAAAGDHGEGVGKEVIE